MPIKINCRKWFEVEREESETHVAYKIGLFKQKYIFALIVEK